MKEKRKKERKCIEIAFFSIANNCINNNNNNNNMYVLQHKIAKIVCIKISFLIVLCVQLHIFTSSPSSSCSASSVSIHIWLLVLHLYRHTYTRLLHCTLPYILILHTIKHNIYWILCFVYQYIDRVIQCCFFFPLLLFFHIAYFVLFFSKSIHSFI